LGQQQLELEEDVSLRNLNQYVLHVSMTSSAILERDRAMRREEERQRLWETSDRETMVKTVEIERQQVQKKREIQLSENLLWVEGGAGSDVVLTEGVATADTAADATPTGASPIAEKV